MIPMLPPINLRTAFPHFGQLFNGSAVMTRRPQAARFMAVADRRATPRSSPCAAECGLRLHPDAPRGSSLRNYSLFLGNVVDRRGMTTGRSNDHLDSPVSDALHQGNEKRDLPVSHRFGVHRSWHGIEGRTETALMGMSEREKSGRCRVRSSRCYTRTLTFSYRNSGAKSAPFGQTSVWNSGWTQT